MRAYSLRTNQYTFSFDIGQIRGLLLFSTISLLFMYAYFVQNSVFNIVQREKLSSEISTLSAKVSVLEANYITMRSAINIDTAGRLGFNEEFNKINFASAATGDVKGGLSYANNEI